MTAARTKVEPVTMIRIEPIAVDRASAALLLGIGISTLEMHVSRGTLPKPRQLGGRAVWLVDELRATAQALPVSDMLPVGRGAAA